MNIHFSIYPMQNLQNYKNYLSCKYLKYSINYLNYDIITNQWTLKIILQSPLVYIIG